MARHGIHCFVTGKVQGVWFRASTKRQADLLNVTGYARNLPDGRVEVLAFGERTSLVALKTWLHQGPELAKVTDLQIEEVSWQDHQEFTVG